MTQDTKQHDCPFYITDSETCKKVIAEFQHDGFIAVDTEFHRRNTYYAQLCLIQVASASQSFVFDMMQIQDATPLLELLKNTDIVKVFHSSRQDLEIFYHAFGFLPLPLFDTQVAGSALGFGDSVSYESLVRSLLKEELDKSQQDTHWNNRPLTARQLDYALADVVCLAKLYPILLQLLQKKNRTEWIKNEIDILTDAKFYQINPLSYWNKICPKGWGQESRLALYKLCAFRENQAAVFDMPRGHILKDDVLLEIARAPRKKVKVEKIFAHLPEQKKLDIQTEFQTMWGQDLSDDLLLVLKNYQDYDVTLNPEQEHVFGVLKIVIKQIAGHLGVTTKILLGGDDVKRFVFFYPHKQDFDILQDWRLKEIGQLLSGIMMGTTHISVKSGMVHFTASPE